MEIYDEKTNDHLLIRIKGSLDYIAASSLRSHLKEKVSEGEYQLVLNMESMDYISSAGFGVLLHTRKEVGLKNGYLRITSLNDHLMEVFKMAGLIKVFDIDC